MTKRLWLDLETRNRLDINHPQYKETATVLLFLYALDDGPAVCWDRYHNPTMPQDLHNALVDAGRGKTTVFHFNGRPFDMPIIEKRLGYAVDPLYQVDIREVALRYNFPASLAKLCAAVGLSEDEAKDKIGKYLIPLFCSPLSEIHAVKKEAPYTLDEVKHVRDVLGKEFADPEDFPHLWEMFVKYGLGDVESMRLAFFKLPDWNNTEMEQLLCAINHRINERGMRIDTRYTLRMKSVIDACKEDTHAQVMALTDGIKITSREKFKGWLREQMPLREIPDTKKDTIERLTKEGDLPPKVAKVFEFYKQSSSSSIAKFGRMSEQAHPITKKVHWYIEMRGAGATGRYSARGGLQFHNMPRPDIMPWVIEYQRQAVMSGRVPRNLLRHAPSMLRTALVPDPGHIFVNADLSSIEGRTLCWMSDFKQQVSDYANGVNAYFANGPMFGVTYDEMKQFKKSHDPVEYGMYMLGKVSELSMLYQGGVSALVGMGRNYGMNMAGIADMLLAEGLVPEEKLYQAERCWNFIRLTPRGRRTIDDTRLTKSQWKALDAVKRLWRDRHQPIVSFWYEIQRTMLAAWFDPDTPYTFGCDGRYEMMFSGDWFGIRLPSGRVLSYFGARLGGADKAAKIMDAGKDYDPEQDADDESDDPTDRPVLLHHTFDSNGMLSRRPAIAHSGVVCNNINQGTAASVLDEGLIRADARGWNPVLHIHDQIVGHVRIGDPDRTPKALEALMCEDLTWAPGIPLAAEGEYLERFAK